MDKLFHRRIGLASLLHIGILALLTLYFFWQRTGWNIFFAVVLLLITILNIELLIHTTYSFTKDGKLTINGGWASRRKAIPVGKIVRITRQRVCFGLVRYLLIEYGEGKLRSIQPEDETAFLEEFKKHRHEEI